MKSFTNLCFYCVIICTILVQRAVHISAIFNGVIVQKNQSHLFCYQAAIYCDQHLKCSGAIVDKKKIVTSSECIDKIKTAKCTTKAVRVGLYKLDNKTPEYNISGFKIYPYGERAHVDIALVFLEKALVFYRDVCKIDVAKDRNYTDSGFVVISGYGTMPERPDEEKEWLRYARLQVHPYHFCNETLFEINNVTLPTHNFCYGSASSQIYTQDSDEGGK